MSGNQPTNQPNMNQTSTQTHRKLLKQPKGKKNDLMEINFYGNQKQNKKKRVTKGLHGQPYTFDW